jgi:hypothetical protein
MQTAWYNPLAITKDQKGRPLSKKASTDHWFGSRSRDIFPAQHLVQGSHKHLNIIWKQFVRK